MAQSILYDLLDKEVLRNWREEAEQDEISSVAEREKSAKEELLSALPEKSRDVLTSYSLAIENRMDYLHYNLQIKILNFGVQLGMELQKSFFEDEE